MLQLQILLFVSLLSFAEIGHSLRCLSCVGRLQPWMCTTVRICSEQDQNCGVRKYRTINGEILYDMDCVTDKICRTSQTKRNSFTNRSNDKEAEVLCEECCHGEFCNKLGCDSQGYPDDRGPVCFNCAQVRDPSKCSGLNFCRRDELCAVFEEQMFGKSYFSSRCSPLFDCNLQPGVLGKRDITTKRCGSCCNTDFCNSNCQGEIIPNPTGNAGTQGSQTISNQTVNNTDDHKEFVLMYPYFNNMYNMYVLMATTTPGVVLVEVPYLSMKKNITLNVGRNYLPFNRTIMTRSGGSLDHKGIYLKSTVPLSVSVMFDYRDNSGNVSTRNEYTGGYMALPLSRLGKQYVVIGYYDPQFTIAAIYDNTTVRLQIKLSSSSNTVYIDGQSYHSGSVITKTLNRLDTMSITTGSIITGTMVFADKDIAVVSGDYYYYYYDSTTIQYLSPVSQWGTTFFIPSFPKIPAYDVYLQMAEIGGNTTVNVTSTKGPHQYLVKHHQYRDVFIDSPPVYIESRKPIQVTIRTYYNSSLPATMLWIPSIDQYRSSYVVTNPNSVTPGYFDESLLVVLPANKQNGLLLDGLRVHSTEVNPTLAVNSYNYAFMTISMDGGYHVITHSDPSVKFGAFVFGNGRFKHRYGYSHYGFPAGIE